MISKKISDMLYTTKAIALLFVITAHMPLGEDFYVAESIWRCLSQIGVIIFFFNAGFLYQRETGDSKIFWKKKALNIVVPWIIWSIITFGLSCVASKLLEGIPLKYVKYFFGLGSAYWYLTVLCVIFMVYKVSQKKAFVYTCIAISLISILLSVFRILPNNQQFNQYTNVCNWIGFFGLGLLCKDKAIDKIGLTTALGCVIVLVVSIFIQVVSGEFTEPYIGKTSLLIELSGLVIVLFVSKSLNTFSFLVDIGKKSFFIYLMHIQIAGIINTRLPYNTIFFILRPFIVLIVCYGMALGLQHIMKNLKMEKKYQKMIGLGR